MFIAVTVDDPAEDAQPRQVSVYLCNGEDFSQWLTGEVDAEGEALLEEETGTKVTLSIAEDGEISGVAQVPGEREEPFVTTPASGDAGLYRAEETFDGVKHVGGWVVLDDGRQLHPPV